MPSQILHPWLSLPTGFALFFAALPALSRLVKPGDVGQLPLLAAILVPLFALAPFPLLVALDGRRHTQRQIVVQARHLDVIGNDSWPARKALRTMYNEEKKLVREWYRTAAGRLQSDPKSMAESRKSSAGTASEEGSVMAHNLGAAPEPRDLAGVPRWWLPVWWPLRWPRLGLTDRDGHWLPEPSPFRSLNHRTYGSFLSDVAARGRKEASLEGIRDGAEVAAGD